MTVFPELLVDLEQVAGPHGALVFLICKMRIIMDLLHFFKKSIGDGNIKPVNTKLLFFTPHLKKFQFYPGFSIWACFSDHLILGHKKIIHLFLPTA